jgi:uncharacterized protein (TIGR00304 family)
MDAQTLYVLGILLTFAGMIIIMIALAIIAASKNRDSKVQAAGAIIIGPIPIIFGTDKKTVKTITTLAIILTALLILLIITLHYLSG